MVKHSSRIVLVLLLAAAPVVAGCALSPSTTTSDSASAPAPTPGGSMAGGRAAGPAAGESSASHAQVIPERPDPKGFSAMADLKDVRFDFDRYDIRPADVAVLDANAETLKSNPKLTVLIEGHADQRGTTEYNMALADRRAKASMHYLVSRGVRSNRISIISYGEERPVCAKATEECWSQNRRAHFLVKAQ